MMSEISDPTIRLHNANCRGDCGKPSGCFVWGGVWMEDRMAVEASMRREMDSVADERDRALDRADRAESARSEAARKLAEIYPQGDMEELTAERDDLLTRLGEAERERDLLKRERDDYLAGFGEYEFKFHAAEAVIEAARPLALKRYGDWKDDGCECPACNRRRLGIALAAYDRALSPENEA